MSTATPTPAGHRASPVTVGQRGTLPGVAASPVSDAGDTTSFLNDCQTLIDLHAAAVRADKAKAAHPTRETVDASLEAHARHHEACEAFRRARYPRTGRVVAVFGEVFTVSPKGARIRKVASLRGDQR